MACRNLWAFLDALVLAVVAELVAYKYGTQRVLVDSGGDDGDYHWDGDDLEVAFQIVFEVDFDDDSDAHDDEEDEDDDDYHDSEEVDDDYHDLAVAEDGDDEEDEVLVEGQHDYAGYLPKKHN